MAMLRLARVLFVVAVACGMGSASALAQVRTTSGTLPDGTAYRIDVPEAWNGTVLIGLDYAAGRNAVSDTSQALLARGFAMAGTTRLVTGWDVSASLANQLATLDALADAYGPPARTIAMGSSLGAHTGAAALQARPDRFDGGLLMCGGLAGTVNMWNGKLDAMFVARTLLAPERQDLPVIGIPDDFASTTRPAWLAMLEQAQATPEGRARIALAAVLAQLPTWSDPRKPQPDPADLDGLQEGLYDSLAGGPLPLAGQAMSSRNELERRSGGNISTNAGVDYRAQLARVSGRDLVRELYQRAGLDLDQDLDVLARAPRVRADENAVAWTTPGNWTGRLEMPVLTLSGIGDNISAVAGQDAYERAARAAGRQDMLRQVYTRTAGHCGFSAAEVVAAAEALMVRLDTGAWGALDAETMNARARATNLGEARYLSYVPDPFVRMTTF